MHSTTQNPHVRPTRQIVPAISLAKFLHQLPPVTYINTIMTERRSRRGKSIQIRNGVLPRLLLYSRRPPTFSKLSRSWTSRTPSREKAGKSRKIRGFFPEFDGGRMPFILIIYYRYEFNIWLDNANYRVHFNCRDYGRTMLFIFCELHVDFGSFCLIVFENSRTNPTRIFRRCRYLLTLSYWFAFASSQICLSSTNWE